MKKLLSILAVVTVVALLAIVISCERSSLPTEKGSVLQSVNIGGTGESCHTLYAGQTIDAGTVCYEDIDTNNDGESDALRVCYTTTGCWELSEIHFAIGDNFSDIPTNKGGNPQIGLFPYSYTFGAGVQNFCFDIPFTAFGGDCSKPDNIYYVAAHAALKNTCNGTQETGWGSGSGFPGRNWAMFTTITIDCGNGGGGNETCETAWAYGENVATCFIGADFDGDGNDDGFEKWGWSNGPLAAGTYTFALWAGAGQCNLNNGTLVGTLTVVYDGPNATVTYDMNPGFTMDETHLYVGNDPLPEKCTGPPANQNCEFTAAPGQFPDIHDLTNAITDTYTIYELSGDIYVVAHAVVCSENWP